MSLLLRNVFPDSELVQKPCFDDAEIRNVKFFNSDGHGEIILKLNAPLLFEDYFQLSKSLSQQLGCHILVTLITSVHDITIMELMKYLNACVRIHPELSSLNHGAVQYDNSESRLVYLFTDAKALNQAKNCIEQLQSFLTEIGLGTVSVECQMQQIDIPVTEKVKVFTPQPSEETRKPEQNSNGGRKKYYGRTKKEDYAHIALKDVSEQIENVQFEGTVFAKEDFVPKAKQMIIQSLSVFDGEDAITVKRFEGRNFSREDMDAVNEGDRIRVFGNIEYDKYANDLVCTATQIDKLEQTRTQDNAEKKRVELHMHTPMYELDGL